MTDHHAGRQLVQRYLHAVERELPAHLRSDVGREIGSLVEDKLEERAGGQAPTEGMVLDVLLELGDPREVARRFDPHPRCLVGPELFPLFARITKIVLGAAAGIALVATYLPRVVAAGPFEALLSLRALGHAAGMWYRLTLALFAQLVVTFYVMERFRVRPAQLSKPFDPRDLPEMPERETDEMTFLDLVGRVAGLTVFAAVVNLAPGLFFFPFGTFLTLADLGIVLPLPQINAWILMGIGLALLARWVGRWTTWLRALELALGLFGVYVAWTLVTGSSVHAPATVPHLEPLARLLRGFLPWVPALVLVGWGLDAWKLACRLLRREGSPA